MENNHSRNRSLVESCQTFISPFIAALIGGLVSVGFLLLFGAYPDLSKQLEYSNFIQLMHDWQTLIGAFIALFAASITVNTMRQQFRSHQMAATKAAKTLLPATLSQIIEFSEEMWAIYDEIGSQLKRDDQRFTRPPKLFPSLPPEVIRDLVEAVNLANDDQVISKMILLGRRLQVLGSWNRGILSEMSVSRSDVHEMLYKSLEIYSLGSDLYDFADKDQNRIRNPDSLQNALNNLDRNRNSQFRQELEKRIAGFRATNRNFD